MANLETLFITIDGSAEKASTGIDTLIGSLSRLGGVVSGQVSSLREYAKALNEVSRAAGGGAFKGISNGTVAQGFDATNRSASKYVDTMRDVGSQTQKVVDTVNAATVGTNQFVQAQKDIGSSVQHVKTAHKATTGLFSMISRIAKTMLIRMALRALMKSAKEGLQNYYEYSKRVGNGFSSIWDGLSSSAAQAKNQLGAAVAGAITAALPLLNALANAAITALNALTALFALLNGQSTYSRAKAGLSGVENAAGGAGGAMKELLAEFDELNVITSQGGGGGGGGGVDYGDLYEEAALPDWLVKYKDWIIAAIGLLGAAGLLGAIMKIHDWIQKIKNLLDWIKNLKKPWPDQPAYKEFPIEPTYTPFPVPQDYSKMAIEAAAIGAGFEAAGSGAQALAAALGEISAILLGVDAGAGIISLLTTLLSGLAGTIKIGTKIDRKEFDKLKKEIDSWTKETKKQVVRVKTNGKNDFEDLKKKVDEWCNDSQTKSIGVKINGESFNNATNVIKQWVEADATKTVNVKLNDKDFKLESYWIDNWCKTDLTKNIIINADESDYTSDSKEITRYLNEEAVKTIGILWDNSDYLEFFAKALLVSTFISSNNDKIVSLYFNTKDYNLFWQYAIAVYDYIVTAHNKVVGLAFNTTDYNLFWQQAYAVYDYIYGNHNKVVGLKFNDTDYNLFWQQAYAIYNYIYGSHNKTVGIKFNDTAYNIFWSQAYAVYDYIYAEHSKLIYIYFANFAHFTEITSMLTQWANQPLYKMIYIEYVEENAPTSDSSSNNANAFKDTDAIKNYGDTISKLSAFEEIEKQRYINTEISDSAARTQNKKESTFINATYDYLTNKQSLPAAIMKMLGNADGAYGIPSGDLFIANEAGAELVGSINGRTSVANQGQIIEGISIGVENANAEQNSLLRQQNELLRGILEKEGVVKIGASASFGRTAKQSIDMYNTMVGG